MAVISRWSCTPGHHTVGLFLQIRPDESPLEIDVRIDGKRSPDRVFLGTAKFAPPQLPFDVTLTGVAASDPVIDRPFQAEKPGLHVFRHRGRRANSFSAPAAALDEQTIRQLRSLGYLR